MEILKKVTQDGDIQKKGNHGGRLYKKEATVKVNVEEIRKVKAMEIINAVQKICGEGSIVACVPKNDSYEITLIEPECAKVLCESEIKWKCQQIVNDAIVVSFIHMPAYIEDTEIEKKLTHYGIELLTPIKRRFYPGTKIADGTRHVQCKFPDGFVSLPYSMKFEVVGGNEYVRVMHNGQVKVCFKCLSSDHLLVDCPLLACWRCKKTGHKRSDCEEIQCESCGSFDINECKCDENSGDKGESDYETDKSDGMDESIWEDSNRKREKGKVDKNNGGVNNNVITNNNISKGDKSVNNDELISQAEVTATKDTASRDTTSDTPETSGDKPSTVECSQSEESMEATQVKPKRRRQTKFTPDLSVDMTKKTRMSERSQARKS